MAESSAWCHRDERVSVNKTDGSKELNVYGVDGLLYQVWGWDGTSWSNVASKERIYFAGRLVMLGGNKVVMDRLGSVVRHGGVNLAYYPYGQERTTSANDQPKFGTYTRDSHSGLDYAMNRYYFSNWGRFTTPDPYRASGGPANPQSWNRYAYVEGDPVNWLDPAGLLMMAPTPPGYCPAQFTYEQCYGAQGAFSLGLGGFEGGGGGFAPGVRPEDAKPWDVWDIVIKMAPALVAAARARAGQDGIRHYPRYLQVVSDCYQPGSREQGSAYRIRTYDVLNEDKQPMKGSSAIFVQEQISLLPGSGPLNARSYPGRWYGGIVADHLSALGGPNIYEIQQFWGRVLPGSLDSFPVGLTMVPLIIREIDGTEHGTLFIHMYSDRVTISGAADVGDCK